MIRLLASLLIVGLFAFVVSLGVASHQRTQAEALLRSISQLQLGTSRFAEAQRLADSYGGKPWNGPQRTVTCSSQDCNFRFVFDNKLLSRITGVRRVEFVAALRVKNGYVISREIDYSVSKKSYYDFVYLLGEDFESRKVQDYEVKKFKVDAQGVAHVLEVNLGPLATADEKERAYSIDLSCLARLHGCGTSTAVFPPGL